MVAQIKLGDLSLDVTFKDIKNVHLSVHPPAGRITLAAPMRMDLEAVRVFAITKLGWIKRQQKRMTEQARETAREYVAHESHFLWGKRYLLTLEEAAGKPSVTEAHSKLVLRAPTGWDAGKKRSLLAEWYRDQIRVALPSVIAEWAPRLGVEVDKVHIRQMKTKWGSCSPATRSIRLNTDLAKKPRECFEYVVVHEMAHLVEPTHNARFCALMDHVMPNWRLRRDMLNSLPVSHHDWAS